MIGSHAWVFVGDLLSALLLVAVCFSGLIYQHIHERWERRARCRALARGRVRHARGSDHPTLKVRAR